MKFQNKKIDPWHAWSVILLAVFFYFQITQWFFFPKFLDLYYHIAVMKGFYQAGGYVTQAFWEAAPAGRPHLYPPLLHFLMLALYRLGLPEISVARVVSVALYPFVTTVFYAVSTRLLSPRAAFYSVLLFVSCYPLYLSIVTLPAFSLAFGLGLLALLRVSRRRMFSACLYLALSFYTHTGAAFLGTLTLLIYIAIQPSLRAVGMRALAACLLLAAPILWFQGTHRAYFHFSDVIDNHYFDIEWAFVLLGLLGMWVTRKADQDLFKIALSLIIGMLPMFFTHQQRFIGAYGLAGFILFSAAALEAIHRRFLEVRPLDKVNRWMPAAISIFFLFVCPLIHVDDQKWSWSAFDRTFSHSWFPENKATGIAGKDLSCYQPRIVNPVIDVIRTVAKPGDVLWSNLSYLGGFVAAVTECRISNRMMDEVEPYQDLDPQKESQWHIYFKYPQPDYSLDLKRALSAYPLRLVADAGVALIYKNEATMTPYQPVFAQFIFKNFYLLTIGILCFGFIAFFEFRRL